MAIDDDVREVEAGPDQARQSGLLRKAGVAIAGIALILVGIPLIPLIGPGWLIVFTGLAILASEFEWADRMRARIKTRIRSLLGNRTPESNDE